MNTSTEKLPDDPQLLKKLLLEQQATISNAEREIQQLKSKVSVLEEAMRLEKHRRFGASSEKDTASGQTDLFNEAEEIAEQESLPDEPESVEITQSKKKVAKAQPKRKPLPKELPRIRKVYELPEAERQCSCGCQLDEIGEECSEQLDIIPAKLQVIQHARKKYACKHCESTVKTADNPPKLLPKSNATAGTLAYVITSKYQDAIPLYRMSHIFARHGLENFSRKTLSDWIINVSDKLAGVKKEFMAHLQQGPVMYCDETTVQVLKEPNKPATSKSYMWVQKGGPPEKPAVMFTYDSSRSQQVPLQLLKGYRGALMTDGYEGYNAVVKEQQLPHLCCMGHVRRKFVEAQKAQPKPKGKKPLPGKADMAVNYIKKLYRVEAQHESSGGEERYQARQKESVPILEKFKKWLDKASRGVLPSSKLGKALAYAQKYWEKATRYVENGDWPIDNNPAENAIRPFVVGRKNWLFSNSIKGANASALLYSIIETAKANGHEPYRYLCYLFEELPKVGSDNLAELMPWSVDPASLGV